MSGGRYGRQTFLDVAEAIKDANELCDNNQRAGVRLVAEKIADRFSDRQRSFDRDLFFDNCGLIP